MLCLRGLSQDPADDRSKIQQRHQGNDPQRDDAVDAPDLEDVFFNVGEVEGEGEAGKSNHEQQAVKPAKGERAHEDVSEDTGDGYGSSVKNGVHKVDTGGGEKSVKQGEGAVIDDAAIPALVDAAGGVAVFAVVLTQGEGGDGDAEEREDEEKIFHEFRPDNSFDNVVHRG